MQDKVWGELLGDRPKRRQFLDGHDAGEHHRADPPRLVTGGELGIGEGARRGFGSGRPGERSVQTHRSDSVDEVGRGGHEHIMAFPDQGSGKRNHWGDVFRSLIQDRGWSGQDAESWIAATLARLLLDLGNGNTAQVSMRSGH